MSHEIQNDGLEKVSLLKKRAMFKIYLKFQDLWSHMRASNGLKDTSRPNARFRASKVQQIWVFGVKLRGDEFTHQMGSKSMARVYPTSCTPPKTNMDTQNSHI